MTRGLTRTGFEDDLKLGQDVEGAFAKVLLSDGSSIEVKSDRKATTTGNIYVEMSYKGAPSGITKSEADWWVYEIAGRFIVLPRTHLVDLVGRAVEEKRVKRGGDYNLTQGALVPTSWLVFRE